MFTVVARPAMPNDLSIQAVSMVTAANGGTGRGAPSVPSAATAPPTPSTPANQPSPNPTLQLDAEVGIVVLEFRNADGAVTNSIPTQQQLDAYRHWQESGVGPAPQIDASMADTPVIRAPERTSAPVPTAAATPTATTAPARTSAPTPGSAPAAAPAPSAGHRLGRKA